MVTTRISKIAPASEKSFAGIFSATTLVKNPKLLKVQHWTPNSSGLSQTIENLRNDSSSDNTFKPKNK